MSTEPLSAEAVERLRDAISGERRDWHRVEVRPDDIAAILATLDASRASRPEPKDATPEPCGSCGRSRLSCERWEGGVWPCCGLCDHRRAAPAAPEGLREALDAAYRERAAVVAALFRVGGYRTWRIPAPDADGWWIVYADTPQGQVSWHVSATDIRLFDDVPVPVHPDPWDGHTTDEKYERVAALAAAQDTPDPLREDK